MFTFTPLLGAQTTSSAIQSILELDGGVKILIDVGWDEQFDVRQLSDLERFLTSMVTEAITNPLQTSLHPIVHPSYSCDNLTSWSLCSSV